MSRRTDRTRSERLARAYLAAALADVAFTANARKPFARHGAASAPSFAWGVIGSEFPLQIDAVKAATALGALATGAVKRPAGKLALALSAATGAAMVGLHRTATESETLFEAALIEALGDDYRAGIADLLTEDDATALSGRQLALPSMFRDERRRYVAATDVPYGEFGWRNTLDVWKQPDLKAGSKAPVLLQVHGGAWVIGQKAQQASPLLARMTGHGWVCVDINYRLSPRATWPDHIVDVKRAIAWVKEHVADYGGDPDFVVITGGSAGGHLASLAALSPNASAFQPGFEDVDTRLQGAVPMYGVYDWTNRDGTGRSDMEQFLAERVMKSDLASDRERWEQASSMTWVNADAPPFFAIHGTNDSLVPVEQARAFVTMLREASNQPVAFAELPGAQHAFDFAGTVRTVHAIRAIERFLAAIRVRDRRGADDPSGAGPVSAGVGAGPSTNGSSPGSDDSAASDATA